MKQTELNEILKLDETTPIIVTVSVNFHIDGEWYEDFDTVTDVKTLKEVVDLMKNHNACLEVDRCNKYMGIKYNEFLDGLDITVITKKKADILNEHGAFTTLNFDSVYDSYED